MSYNTQSAGEAIAAFLKTYHLEDKLIESKIISECRSLFQSMGNGSLEKVTYKNGQLFLFVKSSPLRQELEYQKDLIIKQINEALGSSVIRKVFIR
jgi:hypothetical protein